MRRLLLSAVLVAAAAAGTAPASAAPVCAGGTVGVCYQVIECARICRYHVIVDPRCYDFIGTVCAVVDPLYVDGDRILPTAG